MTVTVENLEGLERRIQLSVPAEQVQAKYQEQLKKAGQSVKLDGFRPGKVPLAIVEQRFGPDVLNEASWELIESTFQEALKSTGLRLAGRPQVEPAPFAKSQPIEFKVTFEVFPEVKLKDLQGAQIEKPEATLSDADLNKTLDKIREQHAEWDEVARAAKEGDALDIDFEGFVDGVAFEGGKASNFRVEIGAKRMIPGFEEALVNVKAEDETTIKVQFPENYQAAQLAGKPAEFKIKVHKVLERKLPELTDSLVEKMGLKEGGVAKLTEQVRKGMNNELKQALNNRLKATVLEKLLELNPLQLPKAAVDEEIKHLQSAAMHRIMRESGMPHADDHNHPDHKHPDIQLPREPFVAQAERRVALGLLIAEVIKQGEIKSDPARVRARVTEMAELYQQPEQFIDWYYRNPQLLSEVEAMVLEEDAIQYLLEKATVTPKSLSFDELVNVNAKEGES